MKNSLEASPSTTGPCGHLPFKDCMFTCHSFRPRENNCYSQYELERQKYARDLIDFDREFSTLFSGKPRTSDNEEGVSHEQFLRLSCFNGDV
jgi:hypothetical protein